MESGQEIIEPVPALSAAEFECLKILAMGGRLLPLGDRISSALASLASRGYVTGKNIPKYGEKAAEVAEYTITGRGRAVLAAYEDQEARDIIGEHNARVAARQRLIEDEEDGG